MFLISTYAGGTSVIFFVAGKLRIMEIRVDWWVLKQLRAQVLSDLLDFIPSGYFEQTVSELELVGFEHSKSLTRDLQWGYLAGKLGHSLFFNSPTNMSARQMSAAAMLMHIGLLEAAQTQKSTTQQLVEKATTLGVDDENAGNVLSQLKDSILPTLERNIEGELKQYLKHLTENESKPFLTLIGTQERSTKFF